MAQVAQHKGISPSGAGEQKGESEGSFATS
jgi:hypothetical protein